VRTGAKHTNESRWLMSLSLSSLSAMRALELEPVGRGCTVVEYAERAGCSRATAHERLRHLLAEGYVKRHRPVGGGRGGAYVYTLLVLSAAA
jgi:predicted transcriptional regulator